MRSEIKIVSGNKKLIISFTKTKNKDVIKIIPESPPKKSKGEK